MSPTLVLAPSFPYHLVIRIWSQETRDKLSLSFIFFLFQQLYNLLNVIDFCHMLFFISIWKKKGSPMIIWRTKPKIVYILRIKTTPSLALDSLCLPPSPQGACAGNYPLKKERNKTNTPIPRLCWINRETNNSLRWWLAMSLAVWNTLVRRSTPNWTEQSLTKHLQPSDPGLNL